MLKKILIIKRLQPYIQWKNDCFIIARRVFDRLNLTVPDEKYKEVFINLLATGIELEIDNKFLRPIFEDVYFKKNSEFKISVFNMIISDEYIEFVSSVIDKTIKEYYKKDNKELLKKLRFFNERHKNDGVVIYPNRAFRGITTRVFNFDCKKFFSSCDNDAECLDEYLSKNKSISIYSIFEAS